MKQIITDVLQAEGAINNRLREAREQAEQVKAAAEKEVAAKIAEAHNDARQMIQHAVDEARKEAERLRQTRLEEADREEQRMMTGRAEVIDRLIDRICDTLLTTEQQGGR